jgi:uncharacterized ferritin-like protein (DUF455 family)
MSTQSLSPPPEGTIERWAWDYVCSTDLAFKLTPPEVPTRWAEAPLEWRLSTPGRPVQLVPREVRTKTPTPNALKDVKKRAQLLHTFLHHELQAAELMGWALLAFPDAPPAMRRGLLNICRDEVRHLGLYRDHLLTLGYPFGTWPINDWFWKRVPTQDCTPLHFVARLGVAFEGANLDHGVRFTTAFEVAGDARAAAIQAQIVEEEVPHAAFALHWFGVLSGAREVDFDAWRSCLPAPLSPVMARGLPLNVEARRRAGYSEAFLTALAAWAHDRNRP